MIRKASIFVVFVWLLSFAGKSMAENPVEIPPDEKLLPLSDNPIVYANVEWPEKDIIETKKITDTATAKYLPEIEITWYWAKKIIRENYLPEEVKNKLILMPNMKYGDDWLMARYCYKNLKIQVIDGRAFTIVIKLVSKVELKTSIEDYVVSMCKELLHYEGEWGDTKEITIKAISVKTDGTSAKYGGILIDRGCHGNGSKREGWLKDGTITWWSNGDSIIFDIQKRTPIPSMKGLSKGGGVKYIGGIAYTDKRRFIRFDSANKIDFDKEVIEQFPKVDPDIPKGVPKGQRPVEK